jgi:hypothetical protein
VAWALVKRGLVVGALAGLLAACFAFVFGEPFVQDAIDLEERLAARAVPAGAASAAADAGGPLVSRPAQRGGLFLATALYGASVGILFALAFAVLRGRGRPRDDWQLAIRVAAGLFVALVLVPWIKYPANPPAVGDPETIGERTLLYLTVVVGAVLALVAAGRVAASVPDGAPPWRRPLLGGGTFVVLVALLLLVLPGVDEVPRTFPASLLWGFRLSSLGSQVVLWTALGVGFGIASVRSASSLGGRRVAGEA